MHFILILCLLLFSSVQAQELYENKPINQNSLENLFIGKTYQQICLHHSKHLSQIFLKTPSLKGDISRIYFFCEAQYDYHLSRRQRRSFEIWDIKDPVNPVECAREMQLKNQAKETNSYVINRCQI